MIDASELYRLAGLLEGEGSFLAPLPSAPNQVAISLAMTDADVIGKACSILGIRSFHSRKRSSGRWRTVYALSLRSRRAVETMRCLRPYMGIRRCQQIDKALAGYDPHYRDRSHSRGNLDGKTALTDEQVLEIYRRAHSGERLTQIAQDMNVSYNACSDIKCGQSWAWLAGHDRNGRKR